MASESFKEVQAILRRRRVEAERAQTAEEQSEVWRSAAAEIGSESSRAYCCLCGWIDLHADMSSLVSKREQH